MSTSAQTTSNSGCTSAVIDEFCYDGYHYHWVGIEGRNSSKYHLGIKGSLNRIASFASGNNRKKKNNYHSKQKKIEHSLIKTMRDGTRLDILDMFYKTDMVEEEHVITQDESEEEGKGKEKESTVISVQVPVQVPVYNWGTKCINDNQNTKIQNKHKRKNRHRHKHNNYKNYNNDNNNSNNNKNTKARKHGLVIAFEGHGNKNGDMWIGNSKSAPTLKEKKQLLKQQKKYEKENLGGFANDDDDGDDELSVKANEIKIKKRESSQLISLEWLLVQMFDIMIQHSEYYDIIIDHLIILNGGCCSGNWCYKLSSLMKNVSKGININVTVVAASFPNESAYEIQGNPNDGGRFYKLLLDNSTYGQERCRKNNENKDCVFCKKISRKKYTNYKQYDKHNCQCPHLNEEIVIANHNNMLMQWSNQHQQMIVVQKKFR